LPGLLLHETYDNQPLKDDPYSQHGDDDGADERQQPLPGASQLAQPVQFASEAHQQDADRDQHRRQAKAERHDQGQPQAYTAETNGNKHDAQRLRAGHQPARDPHRQQVARPDAVGNMVMVTVIVLMVVAVIVVVMVEMASARPPARPYQPKAQATTSSPAPTSSAGNKTSGRMYWPARSAVELGRALAAQYPGPPVHL
jgi:hypothetical protein